MASSLISGAVALLLILTGGYVIAAGILSIAESTMNSQVEMGNIQESIRQSFIETGSATTGYDGGWWMVVEFTNTGSTSYGTADYRKTDLYVYDHVNSELTRYKDITQAPISYSIESDIINRNMWDPSEILRIGINTTAVVPNWTKIVMPNGITASTNL